MIDKGLAYVRRNALGALALFVALGGTSYAATGGFTSGGQLRACVGESGGLTLLKAGKNCKRGQKSVSWSQTGPAGVKGASGPAGAAGAAGPAGASVQGPQGAPGDQDVKWAVVEENGKVEAQKGVVSVTGVTSPYDVKFDRDISHCAVVATPGGATGGLYSNTEVDAADKSKVFSFIENPKEEDEADRFSIVAYC